MFWKTKQNITTKPTSFWILKLNKNKEKKQLQRKFFKVTRLILLILWNN